MSAVSIRSQQIISNVALPFFVIGYNERILLDVERSPERFSGEDGIKENKRRNVFDGENVYASLKSDLS